MEPVFRGIESLSGQDKHLFNQFGRGQTIPRPFTLIHKAFEHFADIQPEQAAASHNGETITYGMLDCEANCLANLLVQQGLQPRQRVCVVVQRSIPMLVAILAVLKTGCQYIPIDGGVVTEQMLSHIFRDTQAPVILCLKKFEEKVKRMAAYDQQICVIDGPQPATSAERLDVAVDEKDGAYIIYTSGRLIFNSIGWRKITHARQELLACPRALMSPMGTSPTLCASRQPTFRSAPVAEYARC